MSALEGRQVLSQRTKQAAKLMGRMKLAEFMSLPEEKFQKLIQEVENDPLFKKLILSETRIIRYKKLPWTRTSQPKMLPLDPAITPSRDTLEVEPFLDQEEDLILTIKKLGVDRFKKYFLDGVSPITSKERARECGLTLETVKRINNFVDKFYLESRLAGSPQDNRTHKIYYSAIASIEKENEIQNGSLSRAYSDEEIRTRLREKYGTSISRRSISDCRKNLKIPSSFERMHQYQEFLEGGLTKLGT